MTKNDILELTIDGYASGGDGVAHHDGRAIFVRRALLNERVRVKLLKVTKTAVFAKIEQVLTPSPERVSPECPHFGKCGGCSLMHMSYEEELQYKHLRVSDALERLGGFDYELPEVVPSPQTERYRNKAIFEVGFEKFRPITGFYRERSHDIVPVVDCAIQSNNANHAAAALREWMTAHTVPSGLVRYLFCRTAKSREAQIVIVATRSKLPGTRELIDMLLDAVPEITGISVCVNKSPGNTVLSGEIKTLYGTPQLLDTLCGNEFSLSPQSFYQVNRNQAQQLYEYAVSLAAIAPGETAVDLYCGAGTITLALAKTAGRVIGVESVHEAVQNARENAERNGFSNTEFICADAAEAAASLKKSSISPSVVVVDPPRRGLSIEVIDATVKISPKRIVYVSCDPATLARDVKLFAERGFTLCEAKAFDMFPRCAHVETVVSLSRNEPSFKDNLKTYYNQEAALRDSKSVKPDWKAAVRQKFCDYIKREYKSTLLELGAGAGYDSRFFMDNGFSVTAVDLSAEMVKKCREKGIDARELDFYDLSPLNRKFDCVYAINTLLHVPKADLRNVIREIHCIMEENGLFFMGLYGGEDTEGDFILSEVSDAPRHFSHFSKKFLTEILQEFFNIIEFETLEVRDGDIFHSIILKKINRGDT